MMKRELASIAVVMLLIAISIWNINKINTLTDEIGIAICKSRTATEQLNFKNSRKFIEEGLEIWQENQKYAEIFLSQTQLDETTQAFYQLMEKINQEDVLSLFPAYDALLYQVQAIQSSEKLSVGSVF